MSANEIARAIGRDAKTVWMWLRAIGIETRPRGAESSPGAFKPGQPSLFKGHRHTPEFRAAQRERRLLDGHVPYLKNGVHYLKGKRGPEVHSWRGGVTPERQAFYSTEAWRIACKAVWHRADAICERCKLDHRTVDRRSVKFHVHHIESFASSREKRADVDNLSLLCDQCHRFVHSRENAAREFLAPPAEQAEAS